MQFQGHAFVPKTPSPVPHNLSFLPPFLDFPNLRYFPIPFRLSGNLRIIRATPKDQWQQPKAQQIKRGSVLYMLIVRRRLDRTLAFWQKLSEKKARSQG